MSVGKAIRLKRIFNPISKKTIIVPMDHGVTLGPIFGLKNMEKIVQQVYLGGANAIVVHKGFIKKVFSKVKNMAIILHLSASTIRSSLPNTKILVATVEDALSLGADAVSVHVNLGDDLEKEMLKDLGIISSKAYRWGVPLLAMVYPRGPKIKNSYDPELIAHCIRIAEELGADIVKVNYTGSEDTFRDIVKEASIPVVIAGGPKIESKDSFLEMVKSAIRAGASGISIGRNVFQDENPKEILRILSDIVHNTVSSVDVYGKEYHCEIAA